MLHFVQQPKFIYTYSKYNEWKHVKVLQSGKRTACFNATIVTNSSGNCLPSLIQVQLNYCVVVAMYSILVCVH